MTGRAAPTTRKKRSRAKLELTEELRRASTAEEVARRRQEAEEDRTWLFNQLRQAKASANSSSITRMNEASAIDFLKEFDGKTQQARGSNTVDQDWLRGKVREYELNDVDCLRLASSLLTRGKDGRALGKKLLFSLSAIGNEEATIRIMNHALLGAQMTPMLLKSSEIMYTRAHLRDIARKDINYRATVLEGKIAYQLGDEEYAIQMWDRALAACVAVSEREAALKAEGNRDELKRLMSSSQRDLSELSSPWIELTLVHYERYTRLDSRDHIIAALAELKKSRNAMEVGCQQDDPTSHYHAAAFFREVNQDGSTKHTSTWLYHMTKAAASGHPKACTALAEFYAQSGWKYIEDEPPDHVKPTPFDSYPPPGASAKAASSVKKFFNFADAAEPAKKVSPSQAARDEIFHTAVFPSTPMMRWELAMRWLEPALTMMYAPAYLVTAKMLLEKTLWAQAQTPKAALEMTDDRYEYASKEAYESNIPIRDPSPSSDPEPEDLPNPGYDPDRAKDFITQVFNAGSMQQRRRELANETRELIRKRAINVVDADTYTSDPSVVQGVPPWLEKWYFSNLDVLEMYQGEMPEIERQAIGICEDNGWDIYDQGGALVYKCGVGKM